MMAGVEMVCARVSSECLSGQARHLKDLERSSDALTKLSIDNRVVFAILMALLSSCKGTAFATNALAYKICPAFPEIGSGKRHTGKTVALGPSPSCTKAALCLPWSSAGFSHHSEISMLTTRLTI